MPRQKIYGDIYQNATEEKPHIYNYLKLKITNDNENGEWPGVQETGGIPMPQSELQNFRKNKS